MTLAELVKLEKHKVRSDERLMLFYIEQFKERYGREPDCAGCTFSRDWDKLKNSFKRNSKPRIMKKKSFEIHKSERQKIHTYKDGSRPIRTYGYNMTEAFAINFLNKGTKKQIDQRKEVFKSLPLELREEEVLKIEVEGEEVNLKTATGKQLDAFAENKIAFEEGLKVKEKRELVKNYITK